ncbi:MAG: DUF4292 domain-containing protein [Bacteroidales bacterium]|nr:DUF4292 domain-containing protein [Bacteroidales bacterium]
MKNLTKIAFLVLLLAATSCASRKKTVVPQQPQAFEWMTANMDIQAEGNGVAFDDLNGQLRMRKDSLVWLSVTATMGVEVARVKVSTDSVWILNRLEKTYLAEPMDNVSDYLGIPLSLTLLQTLLLDNNEGVPPVENQTVLLKTFAMGNWSAKVRYNNIKLNEKTAFPLKITDKMERYRLKKKGY